MEQKPIKSINYSNFYSTQIPQLFNFGELQLKNFVSDLQVLMTDGDVTEKQKQDTIKKIDEQLQLGKKHNENKPKITAFKAEVNRLFGAPTENNWKDTLLGVKCQRILETSSERTVDFHAKNKISITDSTRFQKIRDSKRACAISGTTYAGDEVRLPSQSDSLFSNVAEIKIFWRPEKTYLPHANHVTQMSDGGWVMSVATVTRNGPFIHTNEEREKSEKQTAKIASHAAKVASRELASASKLTDISAQLNDEGKQSSFSHKIQDQVNNKIGSLTNPINSSQKENPNDYETNLVCLRTFLVKDEDRGAKFQITGFTQGDIMVVAYIPNEKPERTFKTLSPVAQERVFLDIDSYLPEDAVVFCLTRNVWEQLPTEDDILLSTSSKNYDNCSRVDSKKLYEALGPHFPDKITASTLTQAIVNYAVAKANAHRQKNMPVKGEIINLSNQEHHNFQMGGPFLITGMGLSHELDPKRYLRWLSPANWSPFAAATMGVAFGMKAFAPEVFLAFSPLIMSILLGFAALAGVALVAYVVTAVIMDIKNQYDIGNLNKRKPIALEDEIGNFNAQEQLGFFASLNNKIRNYFSDLPGRIMDWARVHKVQVGFGTITALLMFALIGLGITYAIDPTMLGALQPIFDLIANTLSTGFTQLGFAFDVGSTVSNWLMVFVPALVTTVALDTVRRVGAEIYDEHYDERAKDVTVADNPVLGDNVNDDVKGIHNPYGHVTSQQRKSVEPERLEFKDCEVDMKVCVSENVSFPMELVKGEVYTVTHLFQGSKTGNWDQVYVKQVLPDNDITIPKEGYAFPHNFVKLDESANLSYGKK